METLQCNRQSLNITAPKHSRATPSNWKRKRVTTILPCHKACVIQVITSFSCEQGKEYKALANLSLLMCRIVINTGSTFGKRKLTSKNPLQACYGTVQLKLGLTRMISLRMQNNLNAVFQAVLTRH